MTIKRRIGLSAALSLSIAFCPVFAAVGISEEVDETLDAFSWFDKGKLLATGAVTTVEGSGGAGLSTWALIGGYGSENSSGLTAHMTHVPLDDFSFTSYGASFSLWDRLELSLSRQEFDTGDTGAALGIGQGFTFGQDIVGLKVRVAGDAVYAQDSWMPQIAVGVQHKSARHSDLLSALGSSNDSGTDFYVAATKAVLDQSLIASASLRLTKANQFGLLGHGSGGQNHSLQSEFSLVYLLRHDLLIGADYRTKPDNLAFAREEDAKAVYMAWFPNKSMSLTAGYADLGTIALQKRQRGLYLSLQLSY